MLTVTDSSADNGQLLGGLRGLGGAGFSSRPGEVAATAFFLPGPTTFSVSAGTQTISGSIADSTLNGFQRADLTKTGLGTLALSAANDYTGLTTVANGTLRADNSSGSATGSGTVTVQAGAKLSGTGRIVPAGTNLVTVAGELEPGAVAPGTFEVGNSLAFSTGSILSLRLGGAGPGDGTGRYSQVNMTNASGAVSLTGNVTLHLSLADAFSPAVSNVFYLLTRADTAAFGTFFAGVPEGSTVQFDGVTGIVTYRANWTGAQASSSTSGGNDVAFIVIPEPSTAIFLAGCTLMLLLRRRHADFKAYAVQRPPAEREPR